LIPHVCSRAETLEGNPTIFQVAKRFGGAVDFTDATRYLINGNGVHQMDSPSISEIDNPDLWGLANQKPVGGPPTGGRSQLAGCGDVLVPEDNYHYLVKEYSPRRSTSLLGTGKKV
jgi:hypothetical protein